MGPEEPDHQDDDSQAIALALAGNGEAWRLLYEKYRLLVYRLAYRVTFNEDDAMDAVQETFLKASRQLDQLKGRQCLRPWLTTIAIREAATICRKRATFPQFADQTALVALAEVSSIDRNQYSTAKALDDDRLISLVQQAAEQLSPQQKAILLLGVSEDIGPAEIARLLNRPANQVRSQWNRAVIKLRSILNPDHQENSKEIKAETRSLK